MSANGFRVVALNGLVLIVLAMTLAGVPLIWVVGRDVYHMPTPIPLAGDYRAWLMAHLEGLLNGLVIIAVGAVTQLKPMTLRAETPLVASLLVAGWGNTLGSITAPLLGVRGIEVDAHLANDVVAGMFGLALVAIFYAMAVAIIHLARPIEA